MSTAVSVDSTLLVLGGTGFFGKSILDSYLNGEFDDFGISNLILVARSPRGLDGYRPITSGRPYEVVVADVEVCDDLPPAKFVVHAATTVNFDAFRDQPGTESTKMLAGAENFARIARKRFLTSHIFYVSSGAVYGDFSGHNKPIREFEGPFGFGTFAPEKVAYAQGKRLAEEAITALGDEGPAVVVGRAFAFFGRHLLGNQNYALSQFINAALAGRDIRVTRQRPVFRSYMDADDLTRWMMTMLTQSAPGPNIVNVGSMESLELLDIAELVASELNVGVQAEPIIDFQADWYIPDTTKAREQFGLTCERTLIESVRAAIQTGSGDR